MKGTLFSADFIEEQNGNIRLLEINTDTAVLAGGIAHLDFSSLISVLSNSNITEVHTISKGWQSELVSAVSSSIATSGLLGISFVSTVEEDTTIYPAQVEDADNKFILRMAYDESAIFDSEYAKNKLGILDLFSTANEIDSVAEYYISSSESVSDYLPLEFTTTNIPDVVVKDLSLNVNNPLQFYKIGKSSETSENRYSEFKQEIGEDKLVLRYYENPSDSKVRSIRSMNIIYGSNLDVLNLGNFIGEGLFEKPTSIEYDDNVIANKIDIKHYYELTTSSPRFGTINNWGGIFEEEEILKQDGTAVLISEAQVGDSFKSYFISGSPDTDIVSEFLNWSYSGSSLPEGSFPTSSVLINSIEQPLVYNLIYHFILEDSSEFRAGLGAHMLIYDSVRDVLRYEDVYQIDPTIHQLINLTGGVVNISSIVMEVLDGSYSNYVLDMETADTFFLSNGELSVKIVTHNCFPAGTKITLADGSQKNIEDLTIEDKILTWNEQTNDLVEGTIGNIVKKTENLLIHLSTDSGEIKSTPLHKFYVRGKRWTSAQDIIIGDVLVNEEGHDVIVTDRKDILGQVEVYHILDVRDNHTYFAENLLVHNYKSCFVAGTEITLANGDVKNIEDVIVGEEVLTYNEESGEQEVGVVGNLKKHEVHSVVKLIFDNEVVITTTSEHPFFVDGKGFVPAGNLELHDVCKKVNGDNSILTSIEVLEESHVVYNLLSVSENHNFYANGILVHNKL